MKSDPFKVAYDYLREHPCKTDGAITPQGELVEAQEVRESKTIQAVKIFSRVLEDDVWLILDGSFGPTEGLACYYAEEIPLLKDKALDDLKEIHKVKLAFPGCRVIQEGPEKLNKEAV